MEVERLEARDQAGQALTCVPAPAAPTAGTFPHAMWMSQRACCRVQRPLPSYASARCTP